MLFSCTVITAFIILSENIYQGKAAVVRQQGKIAQATVCYWHLRRVGKCDSMLDLVLHRIMFRFVLNERYTRFTHGVHLLTFRRHLVSRNQILSRS